MKLIFCFASIVLCLILACNEQQKQSESKKSGDKVKENGYRVLELDSVPGLYIVYAQKNDMIVKIISEPIVDIQNCNRLQVGKFYDFNLQSVLGNRVQKNEVSAFRYKEGTIMIGDKNSVWDLYSTNNLMGLCYIK